MLDVPRYGHKPGPGEMAPDRLQGYVDGLLRTSKTPPEIVEELTEFGLDRETAAGAIDFVYGLIRWLYG